MSTSKGPPAEFCTVDHKVLKKVLFVVVASQCWEFDFICERKTMTCNGCSTLLGRWQSRDGTVGCLPKSQCNKLRH